MTKFSTSTVCLVCMIYPILIFLTCYGAPAVPKCPHHTKKTPPRLYHSKHLSYLYVILAIAIPTIILTDQIPVFNSKTFHLEKTLQLIAIIPSVIFLLTILSHCFTTVRIDLFNSIQSICEQHSFYEIPNLIIHSQTSRRINKNLWIAAICVISVQTFIFLLLGDRKHLLSSLCSLYILLSAINAMAYDLIMAGILKRLLRFCCEDVKKILKRRRNVVHSLRRKKMLYLTIVGIWERLSCGFFVMYTVFFLFGIVHLIISLYVVVGLYLEEAEISDVQLRSYLFESTVQPFNFCIVLVVYDLSKFHVEDILSFLLKFPTRKLNKEEELQVESFVKILAVKQPYLRISELFTVRVQLLASMSGTVLTYVLVAIQFHLYAGKREKINVGN